jgi:hypothetical protein
MPLAVRVMSGVPWCSTANSFPTSTESDYLVGDERDPLSLAITAR